jgi:hypothetical protein
MQGLSLHAAAGAARAPTRALPLPAALAGAGAAPRRAPGASSARHAARGPRATRAADADAGAAAPGGARPRVNNAPFTDLERLITDSIGSAGAPGGRPDWEELEGCWVLRPPGSAPPRALVHFIGGAFVGAAPQLAYRPLLEALAARGALVLATPYATGFDHYRTADELFFKLSRALKALGADAQALPQLGLGHSLGALLQLYVCARYVVPRTGNALLSYNNRPATDAVPLLSAAIGPSARLLGPILQQLATSPLRSGAEQALDALRAAAPPGLRQALPVFEQLTPIVLDVAAGVAEFAPPPEEARAAIRAGYAVSRNLLVRFAADEIDETPALASVLQSSAAASAAAGLELTVRTLPGDHVRPLTPDLSGVSPELARVAEAGLGASESFWAGVDGLVAGQAALPDAARAQLSGLARAAGGIAATLSASLGGAGGAGAAESVEALADEIGGWMGLARLGAPPAALPPPPPPASF